MTSLRRLWKKGVLERRKQGKAFAYHPVQGREERTAERMVALLAAAHDPEVALSHFLDGLDATNRGQLRRLLGSRTRCRSGSSGSVASPWCCPAWARQLLCGATHDRS